VSMRLYSLLARGIFLIAVATTMAQGATERELVRDPHFRGGFNLLAPAPGKRVVYGEIPGLNPGTPLWDLAQWSSRLPLQMTNSVVTKEGIISSNLAKCVQAGAPGSSAADLALAVNAGTEYQRARKSTSEPWVHLLVQQDLADPPSLGDLLSFRFHLETRLKRSCLVNSNDYIPGIHAAQFLVYLTVANRNPKSAGYQECFWFGIPVYDNRNPIIPAYEAQDFGDTKLFIFTPSSATFANQSTHGGEWVTFEKDLLPLMRQGLEHAKQKGFIKGSSELSDYRPLGIFIGWEVPGTFDVDLQIRNLSLKALGRQGVAGSSP